MSVQRMHSVKSASNPKMDNQKLIEHPTERSSDAPQRPLLPEQVTNRLRDMIVQNELLPGERIPERSIAAQLNVSRTPLRSALQTLAAEGLVELLPNRGAVVADPSHEKVREMLEVQGTLEEFAGRLFCANASDNDIAEIKALHHEMLAAFARRERLIYFKLNQRIHRHIVGATGNSALDEMHGLLSARLFRFRYQPNLRLDRWEGAVQEHERILDAVVARDGPRLGRVLHEHLETTWAKLDAIFKENA
jgi:DNA-binding GntR family transcriptional regulator